MVRLARASRYLVIVSPQGRLEIVRLTSNTFGHWRSGSPKEKRSVLYVGPDLSIFPDHETRTPSQLSLARNASARYVVRKLALDHMPTDIAKTIAL